MCDRVGRGRVLHTSWFNLACTLYTRAEQVYPQIQLVGWGASVSTEIAGGVGRGVWGGRGVPNSCYSISTSINLQPRCYIPQLVTHLHNLHLDIPQLGMVQTDTHQEREVRPGRISICHLLRGEVTHQQERRGGRKNTGLLVNTPNLLQTVHL